MRIPRPRLPRQTARLRLTLLYGGVFVAGAAAVFAVTYLLDANNPYNHVHMVPPAIVRQLKQADWPIDQAALNRAASELTQQEIWSGVALAVAVVGAVVLGWFIAGRVLRPLSAITAAARRISASSLHERLALPGPHDELKELSDTLDDLFARLEASFDAQRRFVANASHELRTPINRERTLLQVTRANPALTLETWQGVSAELLASNAEQEHLIEALLTLASSEGGPGDWERGDLAPLASACLSALGAETGRLGLQVRADFGPAALDGDTLLVRRLVSNLIENAARHNIQGGRMQVTTGTKDGRAFVSVTNTGPVIPPAEVDRLFQPFQRLGGRRARGDGHGLGLSIVRAIATAHGATITAQPVPDGGLAIVVAFPPPATPASCPGQADQTGSAGSCQKNLGPADRSIRIQPAASAE
jgi:signal transduction histidine kinase